MTHKRKLEIAVEMARNGERADNIQKATELTREQVKEIIKRVRG